MLDNPLRVLKRSSRVTLVNGVGTALAFLASIYAARRLGPGGYGEGVFIMLWVTYAGLLRPGLYEGGQRELITLLGRGDQKTALLSQNVGFSAELLWTTMPAIALAAASLYVHSSFQKIGFLLAPVVFVGTAVARMLVSLNLAHGRFGAYTTFTAIRALGNPLALVVLLHPLGPLALVVGPALTEWTTAVVCLMHRRIIGLEWRFDTQLARQLLRGGFPIGLSIVIYWGYRLAGPTSVALWLPSAVLGAYAFGSKLIDVLLRVFSDFASTLMPSIWSELGAHGTTSAFGQGIVRTGLFLAWFSCLVCNTIQAIARFTIGHFLPAFVVSGAIVEILSFNIVLLTVSLLPSVVLDSSAVNRQWRHFAIWVLGPLLNYPANLLAIRLGGGPQMVAWNDILVQIVIVVLLFRTAHDRLFGAPGQGFRFHCCQALLCCSCVGISWFLCRDASSLQVVLSRVVLVGLFWAVTGCLMLWTLPTLIAADDPGTEANVQLISR